MTDTRGLDQALEAATVRTFNVPGVAKVRVEIGAEISREVEYGRYAHGHVYPAYRVAVDGKVVMSGADWGIPVGRATDDVDAMLDLVEWVAYDTGNEDLDMWVHDRRELRAALSAPWAVGWREVVAEFRAERGW